jgi:predicted RNase H-like HicB family nuclease
MDRSNLVSRKVSIVIEHDSHGFYAYAPELPGCHSQGRTLDEVVERVKEAIELYLETLTAEERDALSSKEILTTSVEVRVA